MRIGIANLLIAVMSAVCAVIVVDAYPALALWNAACAGANATVAGYDLWVLAPLREVATCD
jgi:uncharacterized membrane protein YagU involved in acid resistance